MTVIELAHIQLLPGTKVTDSALRESLKEVKRVIESYNNLPTNFFAEEEDPSVMYVIGSWESTEQHSKGFSGSPAQHEILALVQNQMTIDWMHYFDVEYPRIPTDAPILTFASYTLQRASASGPEREDMKRAFHKAFVKPNHPGLTGTVGGWNLPKDGEEVILWVQFSGWESIGNARAFYESGDLEVQVERKVKHARMFALG